MSLLFLRIWRCKTKIVVYKKNKSFCTSMKGTQYRKNMFYVNSTKIYHLIHFTTANFHLYHAGKGSLFLVILTHDLFTLHINLTDLILKYIQ